MERKCKICGLNSTLIFVDKRTGRCDNCESIKQSKKSKKLRMEIDSDLFTSTRDF